MLEKRFWYRRSRDGWCGLVSEPVPIRWKKGKDLTGGLLDLVCKAWDSELARQDASIGSSGGPASAEAESAKEMTAEQKALKKKIDQTGMGGLSFFAWFGFIGRRISAKESEEATRREAERRDLMRQGQKIESPVENESEEGGDGVPEMSLEIFPDGDDLAVAITEDLWPGAIKYFSEYCVPVLFSFPFVGPPFVPISIACQAGHLANIPHHQSRHKNKTPYPTRTLNLTRKATTKKKTKKTWSRAVDRRKSEDHRVSGIRKFCVGRASFFDLICLALFDIISSEWLRLCIALRAQIIARNLD